MFKGIYYTVTFLAALVVLGFASYEGYVHRHCIANAVKGVVQPAKNCDHKGCCPAANKCGCVNCVCENCQCVDGKACDEVCKDKCKK